MTKLWRHSSNGPIYRLACCQSLPRISPTQQQQQYASQRDFMIPSTEGAYLLVAAGTNESAVWGIPEGGECLKCFRSIPMSNGRDPVAPVPFLKDVPLPRHPSAPIAGISSSALDPPRDKSYVRAILGRITDKGTSYLVTAGSDRAIRYWDFSSPVKCFTMAGLLPAQPKPSFDTPSQDSLYGKLFISYDSAIPSADTILQASLPLREGRGLQATSLGFHVSIYLFICV